MGTTHAEITIDDATKESKKKKVIKKRKTIKKKTVPGHDGQPVVTEEVTEEDLPEHFEVTITDEKESVIEGKIKPVITEAKADTTTSTEFIFEEIVDREVGPVDETPTDKTDDTKEIKKKKIIKKRKITKNK